MMFDHGILYWLEEDKAVEFIAYACIRLEVLYGYAYGAAYYFFYEQDCEIVGEE